MPKRRAARCTSLTRVKGKAKRASASDARASHTPRRQTIARCPDPGTAGRPHRPSSATSHSSRFQRCDSHQPPEVRHGPAACLHDPARHAAPIDRHPRRAARLDRDANRHGRPEPAEHQSARLRPARRSLRGDAAAACRRRARAAGAGGEAPIGECHRRHRPAVRLMRVEQLRRAAARVADERAEAGHQRGQGFRRRHRPLEQRVLHDAARRRIDLDGDDVDGRGGGCDSRSSSSSVRSTRGSRIGAGSASVRAMRGPIGEAQLEMQGDRRRDRRVRARRPADRAAARRRTTTARACRSAIRARTTRGTGGPPGSGTSGRDIVTARQPLERDAVGAEARRQRGRRQRRELADRGQPPPPQHVERARACRSAAGRAIAGLVDAAVARVISPASC